MDAKASKYLVTETVSSGICNAILNYASAYALFHARGHVPTGGTHGLVADSIGMTFFVTSLSTLVPFLIARHRRRAGTLPFIQPGHPKPAGNLYLRAVLIGLLFTCVCLPFNAWLLPRFLPEGASFHQVLLFKTVYGTVFGSIATFLALHKALHEPS